MKVMVAHITSECNEHISHVANIEEFSLLYGADCINAMHVKDIFDNEGIELIPSIFASLHPGGMIERKAFDFIADKILTTVKDNLNNIDGMYLQLHGASGVKDLDEVSGEHYLIKRIRQIVGKYMPIAVVMDPHGNVTKELVEQLNIVRCYRESPHSDQVDTERLVAVKFIDLLKNRRDMKPVIRKLPIMVGGERSVSAEEPMRTINAMLDEAEKDERVFSDSYHVGYIRHDDDKLGAAIIVVPNHPEDSEYCASVAEKISNYAWDHRNEFRFSGNYGEPDESVRMALKFVGKTSVITDSGDNCGAGGAGHNTVILHEFLKQGTDNKKVLIAGINDYAAYNRLIDKRVGEHVRFDLGVGEDTLSEPVKISGTIKSVGEEMVGLGSPTVRGKSLGRIRTVNIDDTNIDVMVLNRNVQYGNMDQFHAAGVDFHDYDIVVVKMGYLDTYLISETAYHVMALTDGPTIQRSERINFRRIHRPMWPMDQMDELKYIE